MPRQNAQALVAVLTERMFLLQDVLGAYGEIRNRRAYRDGSMGPMTDEDLRRLDDRITNVAAGLERRGVNAGYFLDLAVDDTRPLPDFEIGKLVQISVTVRMRLLMRERGTLDSVLNYRNSRRMLWQRYRAVTMVEIPGILPDPAALRL